MSSDQRFFHFQEGARRVAAAASGTPDRVPIYAQVCERLPFELGRSAKQVFQDPDLLALGTLKTCEKYGIDALSVDWDTYNIEAEAIGQKIVFDDEILPDIDRRNQVVAVPADLKKLTTPDFDKAGRCAMVVETIRRTEALTGLNPAIPFCAPFSLAANIRGISQLIMDTYERPDFVADLFGFITEDLLIPWLTYLKEKFPRAPVLVGADALASLPVINNDIFEQWVVPPIERLQQVLGNTLCVPNQTGERYAKPPQVLMDLRLRSNPLYVEGQDPDVEVLGPKFYKAYALRHNLPLLLGLGAAFLNNAGPDEIDSRVRHYIEIGGQGGGLWFYLCNLSPSTPVENIRAAVAAVQRYGTYA